MNYYIKKASNQQEIKMLKNEINILFSLNDYDFLPHINEYEIKENEGYIKYSFINAKDFNNIKFNSQLDNIKLMINIAEKVKIIHKNNIVHCDLNPNNILIDENKKIYIIDFGISKVLNQEYLFKKHGTFAYCAPEQYFDDNNIDFRTDIYCLGVIFYILLFNKNPFNGTKKEIKEAKLHEFICITNNPIINNIIEKTINYNINKRYKNVDEFIIDLKKLI